MGLSSGGDGGSSRVWRQGAANMVGGQMHGRPQAQNNDDMYKKKKKMLTLSRVSENADFSTNGGSSSSSLLGG